MAVGAAGTVGEHYIGLGCRAHSVQVVEANIPCNDPTCSHMQLLFELADGDGWLLLRPCAAKAVNPSPIILSHDKVGVAQDQQHNGTCAVRHWCTCSMLC